MTATMWIVILATVAAAGQPSCPTGTTERSLRLADGSTTTSCATPAGVPEGPLWNRGAEGRIRWIERYADGRPHGMWVRFSRTGELIERRDYARGRLSGVWERWFEDGRMRTNVPFENGEKSGEARGWYRDGQSDFVARFVDGLPDGEWQLFSSAGQLQASCRYEKGEAQRSELRTLERRLKRVQVVERLSELQAPVRFCYDRELARRPELARGGRVDFELLVTPVGLTAGVELARSTLKDDAVEDCIADVITQLRFPRLVTCELVEVQFPFELVAQP